MSMNNYANSGYVVKADSLIALLPNTAYRTEYLNYLNDGDTERALDYLREHAKGQVCPQSIFTYTEEMEDGNFEVGEHYAVFDMDDLFEMVPNKNMNALQALGITPEYSQWVTWG